MVEAKVGSSCSVEMFSLRFGSVKRVEVKRGVHTPTQGFDMYPSNKESMR